MKFHYLRVKIITFLLKDPKINASSPKNLGINKILATFAALNCAYVVIGSRARLRIWCREALGFESLYAHKCLRRATFQVVRLFLCLGQMQALALPQKNTWSATSRLNMCNKEYCLWGCGDRNIFDFQRYPRFACASLGGRVPWVLCG